MARKKYTNAVDDKKDSPDDDQDLDSNFEKYPSGWDDDAVKSGLLLIGLNSSDKSARDNQNQVINDLLAEASNVTDPTKPRYVGAKKLKQAKSKTIERIQPLSWSLQGDGADEDLEILMTKAVKEAFHRGEYDSSFTGPNGAVDKLVTYGDTYRLVLRADKEKTAFPVRFEIVDSNNLWMTVNSTSFRGGNKNITELVALFKGTMREFNGKFPEFKDCVMPGKIPRAFSYKDLDQTQTQKNVANASYNSGTGMDNTDNMEVEWAYMFDISKKTYRFIAGAMLSVLEAKDDNEFPFMFENLEGKKEPYIPVSNFMCLPAEQGIYHVGLMAYLYDMAVVFRRTINQVIGHVEENIWPHTLINIPQGQEASFFNLVEMANQMRASGQNAYIPVSYNPQQQGQVSSANPILNGGDVKEAQMLMDIINTEFRQCGVYLDEPLDANLTEMQIQLNSTNASVLPKSIMKYNAPEIEFEVNVGIDLLKKYIKTDDPTPLILDTTIELPDGKYSIRGIPFTLGWLKHELTKRAWRVRTDLNSGARTDDNMLISLYKSILPSMNPESPEYAAMNKKIALLSGVTVDAPNPMSSQASLAANAGAPGQPPAPVTPAAPVANPAPIPMNA